MIIGLTGLKHAGKDTVAAHLIKHHGFERRAFADPLKKSVAALFDIPFHKIDQLKNDPHAIVSLTVHETGETHDMTFCEFLKRYGTEAHRDIPEMGQDFWVDLSLPKSGYYVGRNIVVSDIHFDNEAKQIHYLDGYVVEVNRAGLVSEDPHRSEAGLDVESDYTIFNNGTLEDLATSVEVMLERLAAKVGNE